MMQIKINGKDIVLNNNEVKQSRKICSEFLKNVETISTNHAQKSFYFTSSIF